MAEHQIEARILLRYDTLENWNKSTVILKQGEAAVAVVPREYSITESNIRPENTPPAVGIKIGDGYHYFPELPWLQGVAADVYNWAKASTKPTYTANDIQGLDTYIAEHTSGGGGSTTIAARAYQLVQGTGENSNKYYLQSRASTEDNWTIDFLHYIDVSDFAKIAEWIGDEVDNYWTIGGYVSTTINDKLSTINVQDEAAIGKVVVAINQTNGKIEAIKDTLDINDLDSILSVEKGGTGRRSLPRDQVLIGNGINSVQGRPLSDIVEDTSDLVTGAAIVSYVAKETAGLTGAMHYIGEATIDMSAPTSRTANPQIAGYDFKNAQPGDVVTFDAKEYVWAEGYWRLLGDEGSYAVKGSITNADISEEANISQSKIANLEATFANKVDKEEGKTLSSNDYTDEEQQKLEDIEEGAQRNLIEHLYVNGSEMTPTTIDGNPNSIAIRLSSLTPDEEEKLRGIENNAQVNTIEHIFLNENELPVGIVKQLPKSVNIALTEYTDTEKQKLADIAEGAQVNTIETISVNGVEQQPDINKNIDISIPDHKEHENKIEEIQLNGVKVNPNQDKQVNIIIDENAVQFRVLAGARVPTGIQNNPYEDVAIDNTTKKLELARIAATGRIYDIQNTSALDTADYLILRCGDASTLID